MSNSHCEQRVRDIKRTFKAQFGEEPKVVVRAPGRVNLIGEHTDYNEGFVLPVAIDREMLIAASPVNEPKITVYSAEYKERDSFSIDAAPTHGSGGRKPADAHKWSNYLHGTVLTLQNQGHNVGGFNAVLCGNVPQGAGLSSSAAYEVAVATLCSTLFHLNIPGRDVALLAQKAENEYIGVQCGIMDQFISALGAPDSALFIDCKTLDYKSVPLHLTEKGLAIAITNSGVTRGLVDSEYNARRQECTEGVQLLSKLLGRSLNSLRDVSEAELLPLLSKLPDVVARRCKHVVTENARVDSAVKALENGDLTKFGLLMNESHRSLRDDYQVSCRELDVLAALTQSHPGVVGARMTGAGFGGCTVAVMQTEAVASFEKEVLAAYERETGRKPQSYVCQAVGGAEVVEPLVLV